MWLETPLAKPLQRLQDIMMGNKSDSFSTWQPTETSRKTPELKEGNINTPLSVQSSQQRQLSSRFTRVESYLKTRTFYQRLAILYFDHNK